MAGEFAFIDRLRRMLPDPPAGQIWLGDDTAVLAGGLLFATDAMAEGSHFDLRFSTAADAGWKALAVNCSDIAAMGGTPRAAVAAVVIPPGRGGLADEMAAGMAAAAAAFGCPLVGGDTTAGDTLVLAVAVLGDAPSTGAVLRSGARPGDAIFVTAAIGGSRAALHALWHNETPDPAAEARLHRPTPRLVEGRAAATAGATAMIDLSDGLSSDLRHIAVASGVRARLEARRIPVGPGATLADALAGGDDYELCFTAPDPDAVNAAFAAPALGPPIRIGTITAGDGVILAGADGGEEPLSARGFEHDIS